MNIDQYNCRTIVEQLSSSSFHRFTISQIEYFKTRTFLEKLPISFLDSKCWQVTCGIIKVTL